jgi:hypothetical protein
MPQREQTTFRAPRFFRHALAALAGSALIAAALFPDVGSTQAPQLAGAWTIDGNPGQLRQMVQQAIEPALGGLNPEMQTYARNRVAETTWIPATIRVTTTAANITVQYEGEENRTFNTAPGQPQNVFSRSGVRAAVTQVFRPDGGIQQQFVAMDGTQINVLTPAGNRMNLDVQLTSPRLSRPIQFRLVYNRAG